jgi:hypothetical protein
MRQIAPLYSKHHWRLKAVHVVLSNRHLRNHLPKPQHPLLIRRIRSGLLQSPAAVENRRV